MNKNTKKCSVCKEQKTLDNFWLHAANKDGHSSRCNKCGHKKHPREPLVSNPDLMKWCGKCKTEHPKTNFFKNKNRYDGLSGYCKVCQKQSVDKRRATDEYKTIRRESNRKWRHTENGKSSRHKYRKKLRNINPFWKLNTNISTAISVSLSGSKNRKHWESLVGYTKNDLKEHLEKQFKDGMTWNNYGEWHVDHKIPMSWFKFSTPNDESFRQCWALNNLQPKWAEDNCSKGNHYAD